ncbi:hypothetical protein DSM3645_11522 [Blastopirellula marina DSM 3645]|uniref:Uncharacterized protein n=1 Tax=Blastopirellula marina DSM 3645 TaxID=314230 RepID=A3ZT44_9BACT|nr:hypothetical protein DSM3645_11522 [Blastopirellula marina DSM 3645]
MKIAATLNGSRPHLVSAAHRKIPLKNYIFIFERLFSP